MLQLLSLQQNLEGQGPKKGVELTTDMCGLRVQVPSGSASSPLRYVGHSVNLLSNKLSMYLNKITVGSYGTRNIV